MHVISFGLVGMSLLAIYYRVHHLWSRQTQTYGMQRHLNKAFGERQHPSVVDQWTNNPFICQQVGNCKSFTLTQYLAGLFVMHRGPRLIPLCIQHDIQLTSISFQVSRPSHSWDTAISIFYLENTRSRSSVSSKFKVTTWVQHLIDSNPVFSLSIRPPIPMTQIFSKFYMENPRSRS